MRSRASKRAKLRTRITWSSISSVIVRNRFADLKCRSVMGYLKNKILAGSVNPQGEDLEMSKGYVRSARPADSYNREYIFATVLKESWHFDTRESAQHQCDIFEVSNIELQLTDGSIHSCSGFKVEEIAPNDYVISIEAPFGDMMPMKKEP